MDYEYTTLAIKKDIRDRFKIECEKKGVPMYSELERLILEWLDYRENGPKP